MPFQFFFKSLCCTCSCAAGPNVDALSHFDERSFVQHGHRLATLNTHPTGTSFSPSVRTRQDNDDDGTTKTSEKLAPPPYVRADDGSMRSVWPQGTGETEKSVMPWRHDTPVLSPTMNVDDRKLAFGRYKYDARDEGEVSFACGERLEVLDDSQEWWMVRKTDGSEGAAPSNFLSVVPDFVLRTKLTAKVVSSYTPTEGSASEPSTSSSASSDGFARVSVLEGEVVDIFDSLDHAEWNVRKADGSSGYVPMEHLMICPEDLVRAKAELQVQTLFTYPPTDGQTRVSPSELTFQQGEILDIVYRAPHWWLAKNAEGRVGIVPSNFLHVL